MTIRDRLENWAEAAWWGPGGYGGVAIGSIEGRYRRERPKEEVDAPLQKIALEPDFEDAGQVNEVWIRLPHREKFFIKFLYVNNASVSTLCRRFNIRARPFSVFELERARIERFVEDRLAQRENSVDNVSTI